MDNNENKSTTNNSYTVSATYKKIPDFDKKPSSFGKNVALPFFCGILGTSLVMGVCFGVPSIKDKIFNITNTKSSISGITEQVNSSNTNLVSLSNYSDTAVSVANKVLPSVVGIEVNYDVKSFFGGTSTAKAQGSGIIISDDGYILTNNHIISNSSSYYYEISSANSVSVYLYNDTTAYPATIVGKDEQTDLAVIKIERNGLTKAELGDSSKTKVGEFAMAIGNPLGMQSSISCGVISALNREITDSDGKLYTLLQTDAAINAGNSGGALVNSLGQVIGINTMKASGTGIEGLGFAIPINSTIDIYEQLIQYSKVKRPFLGISGRDLDEKTAKYYNYPVGVYVFEVTEFSSAELAGIKIGDVITQVDDKDIKTMNELNKIKNAHQIGDELKLKLTRNGEEMTITITLKEE